MTIGTILTALAAVPAILGYVETFAGAVTLWFCQHSTNETLSAIADAAALASGATTDAQRFAAAEAWTKALSNPRVTLS